MAVLQNKIDFALVFSVKNANPNGDPLNGNIPRLTLDGHGEISDVCLKRKIRNRLQDAGEAIFVQSDDYRKDEFKSLKARADSVLKDVSKDREKYQSLACQTWIDVRSFGQVFAFKGSDLSVGVRGPVTIQPAFSVDAINVTSLQITKSVNSEDKEGKKASDTMGMKHSVDFGLYKTFGSINPQLAELTGFSDEDSEKIKNAILHIFDNDASSARPEGSMEVIALYWWKHNSKAGQYSAAKVHRTLQITKKDVKTEAKSANDYIIETKDLDGLTPQVLTF